MIYVVGFTLFKIFIINKAPNEASAYTMQLRLCLSYLVCVPSFCLLLLQRDNNYNSGEGQLIRGKSLTKIPNIVYTYCKYFSEKLKWKLKEEKLKDTEKLKCLCLSRQKIIFSPTISFATDDFRLVRLHNSFGCLLIQVLIGVF